MSGANLSWVELVDLLAASIAAKYQLPPKSVTIRFMDPDAEPITITIKAIVSCPKFVHPPIDSSSPPPLIQPAARNDAEPRPAEEDKDDDPHLDLDEPQDGPRLHRCVRDIILALREADCPLTLSELLMELEQKKRYWGARTVSRYLKILMNEGTVTNPKGENPPGYRLCRKTYD